MKRFTSKPTYHDLPITGGPPASKGNAAMPTAFVDAYKVVVPVIAAAAFL
jgi:hypothetical protein